MNWQAAVPLVAHSLFFLASLEWIPYISPVTLMAVQGSLILVSLVFTSLFFNHYKSYSSYSQDTGKPEAVFRLWDPTPMSFYFMCFFSPLTFVIILMHCHPFVTLGELILTEVLCGGICGLLFTLKNKFLEREMVIRRIDAAAQDQKDSYTTKYFKQVPKGDYHSKYRPTTPEDVSPTRKQQQPSRPSQQTEQRVSRPLDYSVRVDEPMEDVMDIDKDNIQSVSMDSPLTDEGPPVQSLIDQFTQQKPSSPFNAIHKLTKTPKKSSNPFQSGSGKKKRKKRPSLY